MKTMANGLIRTAFLGSLIIVGTFGLAKAQTIIEMSALKCGDYLESPPEQARAVRRMDERVFQCRTKYAHGRSKRFATNKSWLRSSAGATRKTI